MDYHAITKRCDGMCDSCECPPAAPVNGIPATWFHGEGAYAQCGYCKRYTLDPKALSDRQPTCECGEKHGWSGSFQPPGPTAQWSGGYIRAQVAPGKWANVPREPETPNE